MIHEAFKNKIFVREFDITYLVIEPVAEFKWFMLVSKVDAKNILDLTETQRQTLYKEIEKVSEFVKKFYFPDRINIAMLGNVTNHLHVHIVARFTNDAAWPTPVFTHKTTPVSHDKFMEEVNAIMNL